MKGWTRDQIIALVGVIIATMACIAAVLVVPEVRRWIGLEPSAFSTPSSTALTVTGTTGTLTPTSTPKRPTSTPRPPTLTPTSAPCVCQSATDDDTLRCLIHTESEAANNDDLVLIQRIFAPDAAIFRGDTGEEWDSPTAYYERTFAALDFTKARHFDIHQVVIAARSARYTSGSSGYYAEPGATPAPYYNENPSDHWIFGKDDQGCWVITRFEFNASHIDFP